MLPPATPGVSAHKYTKRGHGLPAEASAAQSRQWETGEQMRHHLSATSQKRRQRTTCAPPRVPSETSGDSRRGRLRARGTQGHLSLDRPAEMANCTIKRCSTGHSWHRGPSMSCPEETDTLDGATHDGGRTETERGLELEVFHAASVKSTELGAGLRIVAGFRKSPNGASRPSGQGWPLLCAWASSRWSAQRSRRGGPRLAMSDVDDGEDKEICGKVEAAGYEALVHAARSHGRAHSAVELSACTGHVNGDEIRPDLLAGYLVKSRRIFPRLVQISVSRST